MSPLTKCWGRPNLSRYVCSDLCGYIYVIFVSVSIHTYIGMCYKYAYIFEHMYIHDYLYALKTKYIYICLSLICFVL